MAFVGGWLFAAITLGPLAYSPTARDKYSDDRGTHLIGWDYFRADQWRWPPTANPHYGEQPNSTLLFTDSISVISVPAKVFRAWLPAGAHPFNIWLGIAFGAQAASGAALGQVLRLRRHWTAVLAITVTTAPFFIERASFHISLACQGYILAAIAAYIAGIRGWRGALWFWPLLLVLAVWTQPYLAAMSGAIWLASLAERFIAPGSRRRLALEGLAVLVGTAVSAVMLGAIGGSTLVGDGLGAYRADLLSFVDPDQRYSTVIPDLTATAGMERFVYLGLGVLVVCPFMLGWVAKTRIWKHRSWAPLAVTGALLFGFSLLGDLEVTGAGPIVHAVSQKMNGAAAVFRANGRFAWLGAYLVIIGSISWMARRVPTGRFSYLAAAGFLLVQLGDVGPAAYQQIEVLREHRNPARSPLNTPTWAAVAEHYDRVHVLPPYDGWTWVDWSLIPYFAAQNGLSVDSGWFARPRLDVVNDDHAATLVALAEHRRDPNVLLFFQRNYLPEVFALREPGDAIADLGDMLVLAPRWNAALGPTPPPPPTRRLDPEGGANAALVFGSGQPGDIALNLGFDRRSKVAAFTLSTTALVAVDLAACSRLQATFIGAGAATATPFSVEVVGGHRVTTQASPTRPQVVELGSFGPGSIVVRMDTPQQVAAELSPGVRTLVGVGLRELRAAPCS